MTDYRLPITEFFSEPAGRLGWGFAVNGLHHVEKRPLFSFRHDPPTTPGYRFWVFSWREV
ncbi:MAG: hypothetical protein R3C62_10495 [Chloroflexota bacterium]